MLVACTLACVWACLPQIGESQELAEMNHVHSSIEIAATVAECFAAASSFEVRATLSQASARTGPHLQDPQQIVILQFD